MQEPPGRPSTGNVSPPSEAGPEESRNNGPPGGEVDPGRGADGARARLPPSPPPPGPEPELPAPGPAHATRPQGPDPSWEPPRKKSRTLYTAEQLQQLESVFHDDHYPDSEKRREIAQQVGVTPQKIMVWFQNRRAKWRKAERSVEKPSRFLPRGGPGCQGLGLGLGPSLGPFPLTFTLSTAYRSTQPNPSVEPQRWIAATGPEPPPCSEGATHPGGLFAPPEPPQLESPPPLRRAALPPGVMGTGSANHIRPLAMDPPPPSPPLTNPEESCVDLYPLGSECLGDYGGQPQFGRSGVTQAGTTLPQGMAAGPWGFEGSPPFLTFSSGVTSSGYNPVNTVQAGYGNAGGSGVQGILPNFTPSTWPDVYASTGHCAQFYPGKPVSCDFPLFPPHLGAGSSQRHPAPSYPFTPWPPTSQAGTQAHQEYLPGPGATPSIKEEEAGEEGEEEGTGFLLDVSH